jgi:hypothetical protein
MTALGGVLGPVAGMWNTWQERRSQVGQAKHEARLEAIKAQRNDWKDELLIVIWSYPVISVFIPYEPIQEHSFKALENFEKFPAWFLGGWVAISLAIFGVDKIIKVKS